MKALLAKFDALVLRERRLIAGAVLGGIVLIGWSLLIEPAWLRARGADRSIVDQQAQLDMLNKQIAALQSPDQDPEAQARKELAGLKAQLLVVNQRYAEMQGTLVPPHKMSALLEEMIGRRSGLRLVSLKTLPVSPVLEKKQDEGTGAAQASARTGLYKHGFEIVLEGNYADLTAYLTRLEKAPQKLLWSSVSLSADKHPKLVLTLAVYTLSLDRTWLIV